jgi:exosome complex component MTR3
MPRRPAKLSNCYVPLPLPSRDDETADIDDVDGTGTKNNKSPSSSSSSDPQQRPDGRSAGHELRRLCLETSVISKAMGSSLVELGHTKVLAEAHIAAANLMGSRGGNNKSSISNNEATSDIGSLKCDVKYAPHVGINQVSQQSLSVTPLDGSSSNNNNSNNDRTTATAVTISAGKLNQELSMRESDLSRRLTAALLPVVILEKYPKCAVVVNITVLQDDGSCLSAAITAASMALVDAQIELRDVVTSCTVAVVERAASNNNNNDDDDDDDEDRWMYLADPTQQEVTARTSAASVSVALICLAMTPNHKEVTLWSQSGRLSSEMASEAMELCRDGCRTMHKFMRESWISSLE